MEENFVKITNVVYKILDYLPDSDPLKNKAKEKALAVLNNATLLFGLGGWVSLKSYLPLGKEKISAELICDIEILIHYLEVGRHQGWIDSMNFLIITKEYHQIKNRIEVPIQVNSVKTVLKVNNSLTKEQVISNDQKKELANQPANLEKYSPRQGKILEILNRKEKAQVADFIKELPKITKRTIRRDLDDLLKRGKVIRTGEWNQVFYRKGDRTSLSVFKMS